MALSFLASVALKALISLWQVASSLAFSAMRFTHNFIDETDLNRVDKKRNSS